MSGARRDLLAGMALLFCALIVPFAAPDRYVITQATLFFLWATVVTQWNLVLGVGGVFSLAQMVLFAVRRLWHSDAGIVWRLAAMVGDARGGAGGGGRFGADRTGLSAAQGPLRSPC